MAEQLTITYDGPALAAGLMEVRDLAPSLLAFAALVQALHQEVHPDDPDVSVRVVATRRGSFEVDLNIASTLVESVRRIFTATDAVAAVNLAQSIAMLAALVALLRRLLLSWLRATRSRKRWSATVCEPRNSSGAAGTSKYMGAEGLKADNVVLAVVAQEAADTPNSGEFHHSRVDVDHSAVVQHQADKWKLTRGNEAFWATILRRPR